MVHKVHYNCWVAPPSVFYRKHLTIKPSVLEASGFMNVTMASASSQQSMAKILKQAGLDGSEEESARDIKIVVVGNKGSGKSSFIQSFVTDEPIEPEISEPPLWIKVVGYGGPKNEFNLVLRELPASENLAHIRAQAYLNAKAVIICYSVADRESWAAIAKWFNEARQFLPQAKVFVVGNKMELRENETPVSRKEGKEMARAIGANKYYEISAYTGKHVHDMVLSLEKKLRP